MKARTESLGPPATTSTATTSTAPASSQPAASPSLRFRTSEHVRASLEDDGAVLLDLRSGKYFSLSEVGSQIWSCLDATQAIDVDAIVDRLRAVFDVDADRLRVDIARFLDHLHGKGLVCVV